MHEKAYSVIVNNCLLGEMTAQAWGRAAQIYAELYSKRMTVGDADILIAAYCLEGGFTLVTANTKDFVNIDDLKMINWND